MAFRDDRDALRAKSEALQEERDALREQLERAKAAVDAHEQKDETDERELARLKAEVDRLKRKAGEAPAARPDEELAAARSRAIVIFGAIAVVTAVAVVFLISRRSEAPMVSRPATPEPIPSVPPGAPSPPTPAAVAAPGPLDVLRFGARITQAEGSPLAPDTGCVLEAERAAGEEVGRVRLFCDGLVYDSSESGGTEMTMHESGLAGLPIAPDRKVYAMTYRDTGTRSGPRPQLVIDSQAQTMRVWRQDVAEPFDLRFEIEDRSAPVPTEVAAGTELASAFEPLHLRAVAQRGPGLRVFAEPCELRLHAEAMGALDCRLMLRCGDERIYGAGTTGYMDCRHAEELAVPIGADDENPTSVDRDPELHLNVVERTLAIADDAGAAPWRAEMRLAEDPRCALDGHWAGRARTREGELDGARMGPSVTSSTTVTVNGRRVERSVHEGPSSLVVPGEGSGEVSVELDCVRGTGTLRAGEAVYEGRFGPGFATFTAERVGGPPTLLWLRRAAAPGVPGVDAPAVDLSAVPPAAREEVRRALEQAGVR